MSHKIWKIAWISVLSSVLIIAALIEAQTVATIPAYPVEDFTADTAYKVLKVIDGDTVKLNYNGKATNFRLIGVDTPETAHSNKSIEVVGKKASEFTRNLLLGESVYLRFDVERKDMYGRHLAYLYRAPDGLFVNLEIVRQGYGHAYTRFPFKHMELFKHYGNRARTAGKGLYGDNSAQPAAPTQSGISPTPNTKSGAQVYVTRTGKKYHRDGCRSLSKSKIPISLAEAMQKYGPCGRCNPPQSAAPAQSASPAQSDRSAAIDTKSGEQVYVTRTGKKYHRAGCRSLSKSKIPMSLVAAKQRYGPCGRCNPPR